jgi:hypothetical protein
MMPWTCCPRSASSAGRQGATVTSLFCELQLKRFLMMRTSGRHRVPRLTRFGNAVEATGYKFRTKALAPLISARLNASGFNFKATADARET